MRGVVPTQTRATSPAPAIIPGQGETLDTQFRRRFGRVLADVRAERWARALGKLNSLIECFPEAAGQREVWALGVVAAGRAGDAQAARMWLERAKEAVLSS